jgi:hypothetical protein
MTRMLASHLLKRRAFLAAGGLGSVALGSLLGPASAPVFANPAVPAKAKRAIWLYMAGGPSQLDTFDYKPSLTPRFGQELPDSARQGHRLSTMTSGQVSFPIAPSAMSFSRCGQTGTWVSELLPNIGKLADKMAVIKTISSTSVNHDPAMLAMLTGSEQSGKPSVGAWLSYGLGALNQNLPTFVVLTPSFSQHVLVQALSNRLWSSSFLPSTNSGVAMRASADPVLFLKDPAGLDRATRRSMLDTSQALNRHELERLADPDIQARIDQQEMAFRLQSAVPELTDLSTETATSKALYGESVNTPGSFANTCLMARRMLERDVRFVQIFHRGWDSHDQLPMRHRGQCLDVDQACYGLVTDLAQRGLLDDTLVIWGGEFGRTVFSQGDLSADNYGRDHHPTCFSMWLAGAGIKPGIVHGETDDFSYNVVKDPVPLRDLHATILHQFGLNHDQLAVVHQGLPEKLVGVDAPARVVTEILV